MTDHMQAAVEAGRREVWKMYVGPSTYALDEDKHAYAYDIEKVTETAQKAIDAALPHLRAMIADEIEGRVYELRMDGGGDPDHNATSQYRAFLAGRDAAARVARGESHD